MYFCPQDLTSLTEDEADLLLNLTASDIVKSLKENLPTGAPSLQAAGATCSLIQRDYISGYNDEVRMPLWSAYTLDSEVNTEQLTRKAMLTSLYNIKVCCYHESWR